MSPKDQAILQSAADKLAFYKGAKDSTVKALRALIAQPVQADIAAAWVAGYYHAGYTNDGAYADKMSDEFAAQWAAAPSTKEQTE